MNNILNRILLLTTFIFIFQINFAQDFADSEAYYNFFAVDRTKLLNAKKITNEADTMQLEVYKQFGIRDEIRQRASEETDRSERSRLLKESTKIEKAAYLSQENVYIQYTQANLMKYKIYMKHFNIPWDYLSQDEITSRNNIKFEAQGHFERAVKFRESAQKLAEIEKMEALYKADSLENNSLYAMERFVQAYTSKEKTDEGAPKFRETETFDRLFASEKSKFKKIDKMMVDADSLHNKGLMLINKSRDMKIVAEGIKRRFRRKRELAKAIEEENKGIAMQVRAYDKYHTARTDMNRIYSKYLTMVRADAKKDRLQEGAKKENKIAGKWISSEEMRGLGNKLAGQERLNVYKTVDSIQAIHINTMEEIIGIYKDYNQEEENYFIQVAERNIAEASEKMSLLIGKCHTERGWTSTIENIHNDINDAQDKIERSFDVTIRDIYKNIVYRLEFDEAYHIDETITKLENKNEKEFKKYRDDISQLGEINKDLDKYQKAKELDNEIVSKFNKAKQKLQDAYMADQKLAPKLASAGGSSPYKNFGKLESLKFQVAKYKVIISMLESVDLKYGMGEDIERVMSLYGRISLGVKTVNQPKENNKKNTEKKSSNKYRGSKTKTSSKTNPDIHFKIQLASFRTKRALSHFNAYDTTKIIVEHLHNGIAYMDGKYHYHQTKAALQKARNRGYKDAYIVAYNKGIRIPLNDALAKLKLPSAKSSPRPSAIIEGVKKDAGLAGKNVTARDISKVKGLVYTVQVGAFNSGIRWKKIGNLTPVFKDISNKKLTKYSVGLYRTEAAAANARREAIKAGVKSAFVIAYKDGKKVALQGVKTTTTGIVFKVQVAAGSSTLSPKEQIEFDALRKYGTQGKHKGNNFTIYTIGNFVLYSDAMKCRSQVVNQGVKDAFVIAMQNGKEISISQALKQLNK